MKYYWCFLPLAACVPHVWGADTGRVSYHVETVAGSSRIGDGGPPLAAQFTNLQGIAFDRLGNLYISDTNNHRVRKISGGVIATIAGTGVGGFSGDGGSALSAQLNFPYGLALDSSGNVYVADLGNQRVRRITPDGTITTVAGTGRKVSSPDGAAPTDTSLLSPRNVAIDAAGNLYIAEFEGHRIRKLTPDGKLSTVTGTGVAGSSGDGSRASAAQINYPAGMAFDRAGGLYFADSGNNLVRKVYADGTIGTVLGRNPDTTLYSPIALATDLAGTLYVGDSTFVVRAYTAAGKWITYAGTGAPSFSGDGGPAASAALTSVNDLASDLNGNLFIADGVRLRRVDPLGIIATVAGDGYVHFVGDGGPATSAQLFQPSALALDLAGNLFIADSGTERVRQVLHDGTMTTLAGTGAAARGAADGSSSAGVALNTPMGVAMDSTGNVLIADTYNHRVLLVTPAHAIRSVAGTGTGGVSPEGTPPLVAQLRGPRAVCADRTGNLYIVDTSNHRVLRLSSGGTLQTAAGNGSKGSGGNGGAARFAQLNTPSACALDSAGNLFIADTANHAIRKVSPAGTISTVAGSFAPGASGDETAATLASLSSPHSVVVDDAGDIFIGDTGNHRIRQVTPDGVIHTIAGNGTPAFLGDGGPAAGASLNSPQGLFLDGAGDLYFADTGNNRIRRLVPDPAVAAPIVQLSALTVVNAISLGNGTVAPGEIAAIFGTVLGPDAGVTGALDATGMLPATLGGVEVRFDGTAAPLFYAQAGQVNVQVPYTVAGSATVAVEVRYQGKLVGSATVPVAPSAPAMLTFAINPDGSPNAQSSPAPRSGWMTFYATGEGLTDGPNLAGQPAQAPYPHPLLPIVFSIAGVDAQILFAGSAPGMIGVLQINAVVPGGFVAPGEAAVELTLGTVKAPPITIWLK
jgi:uncharacterized protein (TIGR03437 family)